MLAMDMFDVKKVLTLYPCQCALPDLNHDHPCQCSLPDLNREYPRPVFPAGFLKRSEQQHGSSWAKKFLRTMASLSLVFFLTSEVDVPDRMPEDLPDRMPENCQKISDRYARRYVR